MACLSPSSLSWPCILLRSFRVFCCCFCFSFPFFTFRKYHFAIRNILQIEIKMLTKCFFFGTIWITNVNTRAINVKEDHLIDLFTVDRGEPRARRKKTPASSIDEYPERGNNVEISREWMEKTETTTTTRNKPADTANCTVCVLKPQTKPKLWAFYLRDLWMCGKCYRICRFDSCS